MNKEELSTRLQSIEWEDFEVKSGRYNLPKSIWETVSAFANTNGGWLVLGISQKGKEYSIEGVENGEKLEQDFLSAIRSQKFNQVLQVECRLIDIDEKKVIAFFIPEAAQKPVYFNSRINTFLRSGSGDQRATDAEIDSLYRDSAYGFKDKALTKYTFEDLLPQTIETYRSFLKTFNPNHYYTKLADLALLEKLHVIKDDKVTVGGLLFFGKQDVISELLIDFRIDYFEVPGTSWGDGPARYTYRLSEEENLFAFYFAIISRLAKKIELPHTMTELGFATNMQPQFVAIREALVNLLMHSDYFSTMKPRIRVFTDRIEFMNPGGLPKSVAEIKAQDFSQPRNPTLARIFRTINLAENAGSGFFKMESGWEHHYHLKPIYEEALDYYKLTFPLRVVEKSLMLDSHMSEKMSEKNSNMSEKTVDILEEILSSLKENPQITIEELSKNMGVTPRTIERNLKKLQVAEKLKRIGPDKGGFWQVLEKSIDKSEKMSEKNTEVSEEMSEKILGLLRIAPQMTIEELAKEIEVTTRTIERNLKKLQSAERLKRVGPDKGGFWQVIENHN